MSILKVARMGHPVLRQRGRQVDLADLHNPLVQKLIDDMIETMHEYSGVGLAGPQVHASLRLFVALLDEEPDSKTPAAVVINPEITPQGDARGDGWEGCLSIPDIRGMVARFTDITIRALDRDGRKIELRLKDFTARVAQHEADHLDGVLFLDRMTSMATLTYLEEYSRFHVKDSD
jgi:peptide deformylase